MDKCKWKYDDETDSYDTDCDNKFCFTYVKKEEEFKFCPYCGKEIKEEE